MRPATQPPFSSAPEAMAAIRPKYISVRVQILPYSALEYKATEPLTAFRLRLDEESTFANVANAALERYAKQDPERPSQTVPAGLFDEKCCALDLDDGVDILEDGEVLKLVLASDESNVIAGTPGNGDATSTESRRPSQTPAVKKIRPRTPALLHPLATRSSSRPRSSGSSAAQMRSSPPLQVPTSSRQSRCNSTRAEPRVIKGSGGRQDPYELPSDPENVRLHRGRILGTDSDGIGPRNGLRRRPSASSSYSSKSVKSDGSLTLTPSLVAAATKSLHAQFQREAKEREDVKKRAALRRAEVEEEKKRHKARARQNRPSAAIARIKSMTGRRLGRKVPSQPIPSSFYDSEHSEEESSASIIRAQWPPADIQVSEEDTKLPEAAAMRPVAPQSKAATRTTSFKPINRLWPDMKAQGQPTKKFGPAYSQRVRDAFSDSDETDTDNGQPDTTPTRLELDDETTDSTPGTPEPFRHWFSEYETNFTPHIGFCSVADGPFKGLIRSGPQKGKYLKGHGSPSAAKIDEMQKTAVPKERLGNFWSSDSEAADDSDDEKLPGRVSQSSKSTASSESDSTSILIMRQLSQEAPPSNQELGILMSSSPSRSMDHALQSPACLPALKTGARKSVKSDHDQTNRAHTPKGAIEHDTCDVDLEVTPNFERALSQIETPSTRSRSSQTQKTPIDNSSPVPSAQPRMIGRLVVKIPQLSAEKQAEYQIVPETNQECSVSASFKSFKEINRIHGEAVNASQDSGSAAIEQVLNASPSWLTSITEVRPQSLGTPKKCPYQLRSSTATTPCKMPRMPQEPEVDLTKDQDPTYLPSEPCSMSESSADIENKSPWKIIKRSATPTSRKPIETLETGCRTLSLPPQETRLAPTNIWELLDNEQGMVQSTPVPAPSIPELLQRIKTATVSKHSRTIAGSAAQPRSFSDSRPPRDRSEPPQNDAAIVARIRSPVDEIHLVTGNPTTQRSEPKRKDRHHDGSHDATSHRKKHKSDMGSNGAESNQYGPKREIDRRDDTLDTKTNERIFTTETTPGDSYTPRQQPPQVQPITFEETHDTGHSDISTSWPGNGPSNHEELLKAKKQQRNNNRKNKRADYNAASKQVIVQVPVPAHDQPPASTRAAKENTSPEDKALPMTTSDNQQTLHQQVLVESPSAWHSRITTKKASTDPLATADKKRKKKTHVPRSARKLLSPPITSRPSSAGSTF